MYGGALISVVALAYYCTNSWLLFISSNIISLIILKSLVFCNCHLIFKMVLYSIYLLRLTIKSRNTKIIINTIVIMQSFVYLFVIIFLKWKRLGFQLFLMILIWGFLEQSLIKTLRITLNSWG